jgi:mono/diheme cytochrome c family protein
MKNLLPNCGAANRFCIKSCCSRPFRRLLIALSLTVSLHAAAVSADSTRGAQVFELQGCVQCHSVNGVGPGTSGKPGPDLGLTVDRGFTPAALAATMWNHAPAMWVEKKLRSAARPAMDEQQAADLFAFFYSLRFFEQPGDAGRGKSLFNSKKCAACHGIDEPLSTERTVKPVAEWTTASDPLELVETMWNHSAAMRDEMARRNIRLPQLNGQDLADLLVYTRRASKRPAIAPVFQPAAPDAGKTLFESKRCISCHGQMTHFLSTDVHDATLTDIAADMWNHGLDMSLRNTTFAPGEMRQIAEYIWYSRTIEGAGEVGRGAQVFAAKKCGVCHDDRTSGAPPLPGLAANGKYFSGATMVSELTRHGPAMLDKMREKHLAWPHFSADEMSSLIAYLNTRGSRGAGQ